MTPTVAGKLSDSFTLLHSTGSCLKSRHKAITGANVSGSRSRSSRFRINIQQSQKVQVLVQEFLQVFVQAFLQVLVQVADHLLFQPGEQVRMRGLGEHVLLNHFPPCNYFLLLLVDLPLLPESLAFMTLLLQALLGAKTILEVQ